MASESSPKSPTSKYQRFGSIFGSPIAILDPSNLPKQSDVIKNWMYLDDSTRKSRQMSAGDKSKIEDQILSSVVAIWESRGLPVLDKYGLKRKYERLIDKAESYGKNQKCQKSIGL